MERPITIDTKSDFRTHDPSSPTRFGAAELTRRISDGSLSAVEIVDAFIERLTAFQPQFNMLTSTRFDEARREALAADERRSSDEAVPPLLGVPITVKECFDVEGLPTNLGVTNRTNAPAKVDARLVAKLRDAGAIVLAKTNIPQLGLYLESDNPKFGKTLNPWDTERTCGGSSGGEAVVAAIGGSALSVGSDLGGSLRVPAHFCGVHAFKPTSQRVSTAGIQFGLPGMHAIPNVSGFMARSVEDLMVATRIGQEQLPAERRYAARFGNDLTGTRFAFIDESTYFPVSPAIKRVLAEAAAHFESCGAERVELKVPNLERVIGLFFGLLAADGGAAVRRQLAGSTVDDRLQTLLRLTRLPRFVRRVATATLRRQSKHHQALLVESARRISTDEYWQLTEETSQMQQSFRTNWNQAKADLLLLPPFALPAIHHQSSSDLVTAAAYSIMLNVFDMPAGILSVSRVRSDEQTDRDATHNAISGASADAEHGSSGLPVGLQLAGSPDHDRIVLGAMSMLESHFSANEDWPLSIHDRESQSPDNAPAVSS